MFFFFRSPFQSTIYVLTPEPSRPHGQEYVSSTLNLDLSFGMCLTDNLDGFTRLAWAFITPLYLLFLLLTAYILSTFDKLTKVFARRNCMRMFWLVILLAYGSLAKTSFKMLKCITIQPEDSLAAKLISARRLAENPNTECYKGSHEAFAIVSFMVVFLILVPLLLSLPLLHRWPRFTPFSDVYASLYKDNRRWWPGVDLLRRLLLAGVFSAAEGGEQQYIGLLVCCLLFLAAHALLLPFKENEDNIVETAFLSCLTLIAILGGPRVTDSRLIAIQFMFFIPILSVAGFWVYRLFPKAAVEASKSASEKLGIELNVLNKQRTAMSTERTLAVSQLRDPLLADDIAQL